MAIALPSQAALTRFTVREPRHLLIVRTARSGRTGALACQLRAFLAGPKPFLDRAAALQQIVAERFTVDNMTHEVVDFYISDVGAGVS